jgi:hypothetical protein
MLWKVQPSMPALGNSGARSWKRGRSSFVSLLQPFEMISGRPPHEMPQTELAGTKDVSISC